MLVLLEHHVKSKANQLKIITINNLSINKFQMSDKNTKVSTISSFDFELVGFQVIGETVHYFWQVVNKCSCKKIRIVQVDQQTEDGCSFYI